MNATDNPTENPTENLAGPGSQAENPPIPPPPAPAAFPAGSSAGQRPLVASPIDHPGVSDLEVWFDELAEERTHPLVVSTKLRRSGWSDAAAQWAENRYRTRWSAHPAIWWGGFTAVGMAVLAGAGVVHSLIDGHAETAAAWFGVALVAFVFAGVGVALMVRLADDRSQVFSAARRSAATTLFWAAIAVAVLRGLVYGQALGHQLLVGDDCSTRYTYDQDSYESTPVITCEDRTGDALAHLLLTSVAATPVALWAWYGHRRPTDPPADPIGTAGSVSAVSGGAA